MIAKQNTLCDIPHVKWRKHVSLFAAFDPESASRELNSDDVNVFGEIKKEGSCRGFLFGCDAEGAGWVSEDRSDFAQNGRQFSPLL